MNEQKENVFAGTHKHQRLRRLILYTSVLMFFPQIFLHLKARPGTFSDIFPRQIKNIVSFIKSHKCHFNLPVHSTRSVPCTAGMLLLQIRHAQK